MFDGGGVGSGVGGGGRVPPYAPYAPWPAVLTLLGHLRAADALPNVLLRADLEDLGLFSPTVIKQILAAFRFMNLIDGGPSANPADARPARGLRHATMAIQACRDCEARLPRNRGSRPRPHHAGTVGQGVRDIQGIVRRPPKEGRKVLPVRRTGSQNPT
jgi:hypothetical protein